MKKLLIVLMLLGVSANADTDTTFVGDSWEMVNIENDRYFLTLGTKIYTSYWDCWIAMNQLQQFRPDKVERECYKTEELDIIEKD